MNKAIYPARTIFVAMLLAFTWSASNAAANPTYTYLKSQFPLCSYTSLTQPDCNECQVGITDYNRAYPQGAGWAPTVDNLEYISGSPNATELATVRLSGVNSDHSISDGLNVTMPQWVNWVELVYTTDGGTTYVSTSDGGTPIIMDYFTEETLQMLNVFPYKTYQSVTIPWTVSPGSGAFQAGDMPAPNRMGTAGTGGLAAFPAPFDAPCISNGAHTGYGLNCPIYDYTSAQYPALLAGCSKAPGNPASTLCNVHGFPIGGGDPLDAYNAGLNADPVPGTDFPGIPGEPLITVNGVPAICCDVYNGINGPLHPLCDTVPDPAIKVIYDSHGVYAYKVSPYQGKVQFRSALSPADRVDATFYTQRNIWTGRFDPADVGLDTPGNSFYAYPRIADTCGNLTTGAKSNLAGSAPVFSGAAGISNESRSVVLGGDDHNDDLLPTDLDPYLSLPIDDLSTKCTTGNPAIDASLPGGATETFCGFDFESNPRSCATIAGEQSAPTPTGCECCANECSPTLCDFNTMMTPGGLCTNRGDPGNPPGCGPEFGSSSGMTELSALKVSHGGGKLYLKSEHVNNVTYGCFADYNVGSGIQGCEPVSVPTLNVPSKINVYGYQINNNNTSSTYYLFIFPQRPNNPLTCLLLDIAEMLSGGGGIGPLPGGCAVNVSGTNITSEISLADIGDPGTEPISIDAMNLTLHLTSLVGLSNAQIQTALEAQLFDTDLLMKYNYNLTQLASDRSPRVNYYITGTGGGTTVQSAADTSPPEAPSLTGCLGRCDEVNTTDANDNDADFYLDTIDPARQIDEKYDPTSTQIELNWPETMFNDDAVKGPLRDLAGYRIYYSTNTVFSLWYDMNALSGDEPLGAQTRFPEPGKIAESDGTPFSGFPGERIGCVFESLTETNCTNDEFYLPEDGQTYKFKIEAYDTTGNVSQAATQPEVTILRNTIPPLTPTIDTSVANISRSPGSITVRWVPSADADLGGYAVYRCPARPLDAVKMDEGLLPSTYCDGDQNYRRIGTLSSILSNETIDDGSGFYEGGDSIANAGPSYGDDDGDWTLADDVGLDGIISTADFGESDGLPTPGEPNAFEWLDCAASDSAFCGNYATGSTSALYVTSDATRPVLNGSGLVDGYAYYYKIRAVDEPYDGDGFSTPGTCDGITPYDPLSQTGCVNPVADHTCSDELIRLAAYGGNCSSYSHSYFAEVSPGDYSCRNPQGGEPTGQGCKVALDEIFPPIFGGIATATDVGTSGAVDISWATASDYSPPITYNIYIATASGGQNFMSPDYSTAGTSFQKTGLTNNVPYYFVVRAEDSLGHEDTNVIQLSATPTDPVPPTFAGITSGVDTGVGGSILLGWSAGADASPPITYNVYSATLSGGQNFLSPATSTTATSAEITDLTNNSPYYFVVRAEDAYGNEDTNSVELWATPTDIIAPTFAGITSAADAGTGGAVDLGWSAASDISTPITYNIYSATSSGGQNFASADYSTTSTSLSVTGLTDDIPYYFVVRAEDSLGNEDTNLIELAATPTTAIDSNPPVFSGISSATGCGSGCMRVAWTAAVDGEGSTPITYNIHSATTSGGQNFSTPATTTTGTSFSMTGLTDGATYYFVVRAEDSAGNEDTNTTEVSGTPAFACTNCICILKEGTYTLDANACMSAEANVEVAVGETVDFVFAGTAGSFDVGGYEMKGTVTVASGTFAAPTLDLNPGGYFDSVLANTFDSTSYNMAYGRLFGSSGLRGSFVAVKITFQNEITLTLTPNMTFTSVIDENSTELMTGGMSETTITVVTPSDTTPPTQISTVSDGTGTDADYTTSTTQLSANWSAATDAGSGIAAYWYSIGTTAGASNTKVWTSVGTATSVTATGLTLSNGTTYYFSVKAVDGSGNFATPTVSDGITVDNTAPTVTITSPADGATTKTAAATVSGTTDTGASVTVNGQTATVSGTTFSRSITLSEGSNTITATATDAAGNSASDSVAVTLDSQGPTVSITSPASGATTGGSITVLGTVSDANLSLYTLYYGVGSSPTTWKPFASSTVAVASGALGTFDASSLNGEYSIKLEASDSLANSANTTVSFTVSTSVTTRAVTLSSNWTMVSFPMTPDTTTKNTLLSESSYKVYWWDPAAEDDPVYAQYVKPTTFAAGQGVWVKPAGGAASLTLTGAPVDSTADYEYTLKQGWNQIGAPFNWDFTWSKVVVINGTVEKTLTDAVTATWIESSPFYYDGTSDKTGWKQVSETAPPKMAAGKGYFLYAPTDGVKLIYAPGSEDSVYGLARLVRPDPALRVKISAETQNAEDTDNIIGLADYADDNHDGSDLREPPGGMDTFVSLSFPHKTWGNDSGDYTNDFRRSAGRDADCPEVDLCKIWEMELATNDTGSAVTLKWDSLSRFDGRYSITLLDTVTGTEVNMITTTEYSYTPSSGAEERRFRITVIALTAEETASHTLSPGWNLISIPLDPEITSALKQIGDDLSVYDIFQYYDGRFYDKDAPEGVDLQAGLGYWLYVPDAAVIEVTGVPVSAAKGVEAPLRTGWNLIGNPFAETLAWDDNITVSCGATSWMLRNAISAGKIGARAFGLGEGGKYIAVEPGGVLGVWKGYFVKSAGECSITLKK